MDPMISHYRNNQEFYRKLGIFTGIIPYIFSFFSILFFMSTKYINILNYYIDIRILFLISSVVVPIFLFVIFFILVGLASYFFGDYVLPVTLPILAWWAAGLYAQSGCISQELIFLFKLIATIVALILSLENALMIWLNNKVLNESRD